jgi:hypothetical protein
VSALTGLADVARHLAGCDATQYTRHEGSKCVDVDDDVASNICQTLASGTAELPQIYANFKNGKSEGISFAFVVTWLTGDVFNLLGCVTSPTLPTQLYTVGPSV